MERAPADKIRFVVECGERKRRLVSHKDEQSAEALDGRIGTRPEIARLDALTVATKSESVIRTFDSIADHAPPPEIGTQMRTSCADSMNFTSATTKNDDALAAHIDRRSSTRRQCARSGDEIPGLRIARKGIRMGYRQPSKSSLIDQGFRQGVRRQTAMSPAQPNKIPAALNILIATSAGVIALMLLRAVSNSESWLLIAVLAIAFSFIANTIFSCLHECVHGIFHSNQRINDAFGVLLAAFFPTGFSLQRSAHMGHHARNRSDHELFDYYYPDDSRVLKTIQWYGIISGAYWIFVVIGWWLYLLCPFLFRRTLWQRHGPAIAEHTSGPAYARSFSEAPPVRARLELLFTIAFQIGVFVALDLTVTGWLICYLAFGFNWSALQYADHAFSPIDPIDGAWDLRVHPWIQAVFLNYHLHRAHHHQPNLPWTQLPRFVDENLHRPHFLAHYLRMWLGPRPIPGDRAAAEG